MATTTYTDNVVIDGSRDISQLTIQGHTTQDLPLQEWQTSGATPQARLTGDGRLQVGSFGDGFMDNPEALVQAHRAEADTAKPKRGFHLKGFITGTLSDLVAWVVHELTLKGTSGISALHTALRVRFRNEVTGSMSGAELRGSDIEVTNAGGTSGNPVPNLSGLRLAVINESTGYTTTAYGLKIEVQNTGQLSQAYALYTDVGLVHVEDAIEMKRLTASPATPAQDHIRLYGRSDGFVYVKNWQGVETNLSRTSKQIEIDFGSFGTRSHTFTITDSEVTATSRVIAVQSGKAATGRQADENEMDALHLRCVSGNGILTIYADSLFGPVAGRYVVDYKIQ